MKQIFLGLSDFIIFGGGFFILLIYGYHSYHSWKNDEYVVNLKSGDVFFTFIFALMAILRVALSR